MSPGSQKRDLANSAGESMSSDEKKRRREKFFLERFLELRGIKPRNVEQLQPPNPDFLINLDGRMVGIEITEIFIQPDKSNNYQRGADELLLQEIDSFKDRIVSEAQKVYFETNGTSVLATITFSHVPRAKKNSKQIAELIADKVRDMVSGNTSDEEHWRPDVLDNETNLLSEAVAAIDICRVPERRFARWEPTKAGIVTNLTPEHLQDRIDLKAQKLSNYRKNKEFSEIWLLMVADRTRPSQKLHHTLGHSLYSVSSPFDKTFYYCHASDEPVVEL